MASPRPSRDLQVPRSRRDRPAGDDGAEGADGGRRDSCPACTAARTRASASSSPSTGSTCPGDDLSTLDWKVYARSDRHYVKKFEEETNLECHLLLDVSASMAYRGGAPMSKLEYGIGARGVAGVPDEPAARRDRADRVRSIGSCLGCPPGARPGHLHALLLALERLRPGTAVGSRAAAAPAGRRRC